ncbi:protein polyglycylase TTLL10-like [Pristis pectinata]|uniref:protein polyglycylase TTLL10-like n=1 Tax=Pristis pectinata TaxID=685728 RepID=UPI00223E86B5|nr:protein polyglycylase TTLL10-like [Pristis pectinata]
MNTHRPVKKTQDELKAVKRPDSAARTTANGGNLSGGAQDEISEEVNPLTKDTRMGSEQTNDGSGMERNQCLPDLARVSGDRPVQWEDEVEAAAAELPNENKKLLNQTVQALFYQAKRFSNKGTYASQTKSENAKSRNGISLQKTRGTVSPRALKPRKEDNKDCRPIFYVSGTNGTDLIVSFCENRGWKRINDNNRCDYLLKWCEVNVSSNFQYFQEGKQLLNQIPNNKLLTTKAGLCSALKNYQQAVSKYGTIMNPRILKMEDFYPETFRMDVKSERLAFFEIMGDGSIWISKPAGSNLGRGIFLLKCQEDLLDFRKKVESVEQNSNCRMSYSSLPFNRIVQRYLHKPLLLEGRKFDIRSYFLIACTSPYMIFFCHGYVKLSCNKYDPYSDDLTSHLTNQFIQKKNPRYSDMKEDTIWSMEHLNEYINEKYMESKHLPKDWVFTVFAKRMQQIMVQCFSAVKGKLECKLGYFDLLGCDFIIDHNFKVWLLEMNANPSLQRHCSVLKTVIPKVVNEALDLVVEIFNKCSKGLNVLPLQSQKEFVLLYSGCHQGKRTRPIPVGTERNTSPAVLKQPLCSVKQAVNKPMKKLAPSSDSMVAPAKMLRSTVSLISYKKLPVIQLSPSLCTVRNGHQTEGSALMQDQLRDSRDLESFKPMPYVGQLKPVRCQSPLVNCQQHPRAQGSSLMISSVFPPAHFNKTAAKPSELKGCPKEKQIPLGDVA